MEKEIKIKTKDSHVIYGVLNSLKKKSKKLIIFVHGLGGHKDEHIFFNAVPYFTKKGFDVFRFDLYTWQKYARHLSRSTLSTHAKDLNHIANFFGKKYKSLYVVGHSYGGTTVLLSDTSQFKAIILWDPTAHKHVDLTKSSEYKYDRKSKQHSIDWGIKIVLGDKMIKEGKKLTSNLLKKASQVQTPIKIVGAGEGILLKSFKELISQIAGPKDLVIIKGADHNFNPQGTEKQLFNETYKWVKKF